MNDSAMPTYDLLNEHKCLLPELMRKAVNDWQRTSEPSAKYATLLQVVEVLAMRLTSMANTAYLTLDLPVPKVENLLRKASSKKRSFGDIEAGLQGLLAISPSQPLAVSLHAQLAAALDSQLGIGGRRFAHGYILAKEAGMYGIPPALVKNYIYGHIGKADSGTSDKSPLKQATMKGWLNLMVGVRNDATHCNDVDRVKWWRGAPEWYETLHELLRPAVKEVLALPQVACLLVEYELATFSGQRQVNDNQWEFDVKRDLGPDQVPESGWKYTSLRPLPLPQGQVLVRRRLTDLSADWIAWRDFPAPAQSSEQLLADYRLQFALMLCSDGCIDPAERTILDEWSRVKLDGLENPAHSPRLEEDAVIAAWRSALLWASSDTPEQGKAYLDVRAWLPPEKQDPKHARTHLLQLLKEQKKQVRAIIAAAGVYGVTEAEALKRAPTLPAAVFAHVLGLLKQELELDGVAVTGERLVSKNAGDTFANQVAAACLSAAEVCDPGEAARLKCVAEVFHTLLSEVASADAHIERAAKAVEVLVQRCTDVVGDGDLVLTQSGTAADASGDGSGPLPQEKAQKPLLFLEIDGVRCESRSLTKLMRDLARLDQPDQPDRHGRLVALATGSALPYVIGTSRCLASTEPTHANGTKFAYPIEVSWGGHKVYFEAAISPASWAVQELALWFTNAGFVVATNAGKFNAAPALLSATAEAETSAKLTVLVSRHDGPGQKPITGNTVPEFLQAVVRHLLEDPKAHEQLLKSLPVRAGYKRYIINGDSPHHPSDQPFRRLVEVQFLDDGGGGEGARDLRTLFIEGHFSHRDAVLQALKVCDAAGVDAFDPSDEEDDSAQDMGTDSALAEELPTTVTDAVEGALATLQCVVAGEQIDASTVKELFTRALDALALRGWLPALHADVDKHPYKIVLKSGRDGFRYLCSTNAVHANGRDFRVPLRHHFGGCTLYLETNLNPTSAVALVQGLVNHVEQLAKEPPAAPAAETEAGAE